MTADGIWVYQRGELWATGLPSARSETQVKPRIKAHFEEVGPAAAGSLAQAMGHPDATEIRKHLEGTRRCFVAHVGSEIASYCWSSQEKERVGEMERTIRLQGDEAYIWGCATLPAFRRQHLYTALLGFMSRRLTSEGLQRIWIGANLENTPSLRAFDSAGFRPVARMTYARLLALSALVTRPASGVPRDLIGAARRLFTMPGERRWGGLTIGWRQAK